MIRLIYGIPGAGKTALMVALCIEQMYGENSITAMEIANNEVLQLNYYGYNVSPPKFGHTVYCSKVVIDVTSPNFGHRRSMKLYPDRLGIAVDGFKAQYVYRGSTLGLDELPSIADSRNWGQFPEAMCRYFAEHRKHLLTIYATCQDVDQVEKRIRRLATITEVRSLNFVEDKFGNVTKSVWELNNWACCRDWERGLEPEIEYYEYDGDIRECYNTYEGEEQFYAGLDGADFSCETAGYSDYSPQGVANYMANNPIQSKKE